MTPGVLLNQGYASRPSPAQHMHSGQAGRSLRIRIAQRKEASRDRHDYGLPTCPSTLESSSESLSELGNSLITRMALQQQRHASGKRREFSSPVRMQTAAGTAVRVKLVLSPGERRKTLRMHEVGRPGENAADTL